MFLHIIDCSQNNFIENYKKIRNEIIKYGRKLKEKPEIIAISKSDLNQKDLSKYQKIVKTETGKIPYIFSSHTKNGIEVLGVSRSKGHFFGDVSNPEFVSSLIQEKKPSYVFKDIHDDPRFYFVLT